MLTFADNLYSSFVEAYAAYDAMDKELKRIELSPGKVYDLPKIHNCCNCGAPVKGHRCEYCGTQY